MSDPTAAARAGRGIPSPPGPSAAARGGLGVPRTLAWLAAWGLGVLALWPPADVAQALAGASRVALVWAPWVALVGLPGARDGAAGDPRRAWPLALGLALPLVALAAWIDLRAGLGRPRVEADLACGLALLGLLGEARHQAQLRAVGAYGWAWLVLLGGLPALAVTLAWGAGERLGVDDLPGRLQRFSPLGTLWSEVRPAEPDAGWLAGVRRSGTSAALALLLLTTWLGARRGGGEA